MSRSKSLPALLAAKEYGFYDHNPDEYCAQISRALADDNAYSFDLIYKTHDLQYFTIVRSQLYGFQGNTKDSLFNELISFDGFEKPYKQLVKPHRYQEMHDFVLATSDSLKVAPIPKRNYPDVFYHLATKVHGDEQFQVLVAQDEKTLDMLDQYYLCRKKEYRLKDLHFESLIDRLYLTTGYLLKKPICFAVIALRTHPLRLLGFVEFPRNVLGVVRKIDFTSELMSVLICGHVDLYCFDDILCEENKLFELDLDRHVRTLGGVAGRWPTAMQANYRVRAMPPKLYSVHCDIDMVNFSDIPWVFVVNSELGIYRVFDMDQGYKIGEFGDSEAARMYPEEELVQFDFDTKRLFYSDRHKILVYAVRGDPKTLSLVKRIVFEATIQSERRSRSGRLITGSYNVTPNRIVDVNLHTAFNLLIVFAYVHSESCNGVIYIYDSRDFRQIAKVNTPLEIREECSYTVVYAIDHLFIMIQGSPPTEIQVFKRITNFPLNGISNMPK